MTIQAKLLCTLAVTGFAAFALTPSAQALSMTECSAKYKAAKSAGNTQKWNDFRKAECGADAAATPAAAPAATPAAAAPAAAPAAPKAAEAKPKS